MSRVPSNERARPDGGGEEAGITGRRPPETGGRPPREDLTPHQLRAIAALLSSASVAAAAAEVGVHPRTISRWFKEEPFSLEYWRQMSELQLELWHRMLAVKDEAWARFLELMRGTDDRISLRAATWYLERMLSVPAIIARNGLAERGTESDLSPRARALLDQAEAIERAEGDSDED